MRQAFVALMDVLSENGFALQPSPPFTPILPNNERAVKTNCIVISVGKRWDFKTESKFHVMWATNEQRYAVWKQPLHNP